MAATYKQSFRFVGKTYPFKSQLMRLGGRWSADQKAWVMPAAVTKELRAEQVRLVNELHGAGIAVHFDTVPAQPNLSEAA